MSECGTCSRRKLEQTRQHVPGLIDVYTPWTCFSVRLINCLLSGDSPHTQEKQRRQLGIQLHSTHVSSRSREFQLSDATADASKSDGKTKIKVTGEPGNYSQRNCLFRPNKSSCPQWDRPRGRPWTRPTPAGCSEVSTSQRLSVPSNRASAFQIFREACLCSRNSPVYTSRPQNYITAWRRKVDSVSCSVADVHIPTNKNTRRRREKIQTDWGHCWIRPTIFVK